MHVEVDFGQNVPFGSFFVCLLRDSATRLRDF